MTGLRRHLDARRASGHKLLIPYVMAGLPDPDRWAAALATIAAEADAVEIGLPHSDPLMDGPVIAGAAERALALGVTPVSALELARALSAAPKVVMTYYNPIHRLGESTFCRRAASADVTGLIVPDLPLEESGPLRAAAAAEGLAWIPLVAPTSPAERVKRIAATATGFVYAVSAVGVTGARASLAATADEVASACRGATDLPVLVGIGVSTPEQARSAAAAADGVVVGSAVVARISEDGPTAAAAWIASVRATLD